MKTNIIDQYSPQNTCQYETNRHVKYTSNNQSKIYLQDKICVSNELKRTVRTGDNQQVEFIYSSRNKRVTATVINKSGEKKQVRSEDLPKELKQISNPKGFKAFLSSIHVKVNTLSNGDYKLYVNQKGLGGMMSRSGSITPETQGNENFRRLELQQEQLHEQLLLCVQEKNYNQTQDILSTLVEQQHITYPEKVIFELDYQEGINLEAFEEVKQEELQPQVPITQGGPLVKRFGINPETVPGVVGYNITYDRLHYVEQEVFNLAIQELSDKSSAQAFQFQRTIKNIENITLKAAFQILKNKPLTQIQEYPHNVVVVDIFAREQAKIKEDKYLPETHTVVLWKKRDNKIVLIDPNNAKFSEHIKEACQKSFNKDLTLSNIKKGIIYSTNDKKTSYCDYNTEPQPRDCIDIAVKIAFEINEQQSRRTNLNDIETSTFNAISNNTTLNTDLPKVLDTTFIREIQSSNYKVRKDAIITIRKNEEVIKAFIPNRSTEAKLPKNLNSVSSISKGYDTLQQNELYKLISNNAKSLFNK